MLEKVAHMAAAEDMGIAIHFCEVWEDVRLIRERYHMEPGEFMESVGIFTPRPLLAHAIWLNHNDMDRIAKHRTTVVHCPTSNAKLASGICPVPELLESGVNVALGTDASTCDNSCDMFSAMKLAAVIQKARTLSPTVVPAETVIEMATINGALALGMEKEIGSLEVGKKADLICIRCDSARIAPNGNPVSAVVYSAAGSDVDDVMIDGKWVVQKGVALTLDEKGILRDASEAIARVLKKTGVSNRPRWPVS
jgi:cytosine/adenosine deaminase-related metal-dependent hydrolase